MNGHLEELETTERTHDNTKSVAALGRLNRSLAGGVGSGGRVEHKNLFLKRGSGARVEDVDGREYVDYMMGFGALILGHAHPAITQSIASSISDGTMFGAACEAELKLAEKVVELLPCADLVRFTSSGTEAVQAAIRLARAATDREKILKFEGHFHGWADSVYISVKTQSNMGSVDFPSPLKMTRGQPDSVLDDIVVAHWNDVASLEQILAAEGPKIAAIILEPYPTNNGCMESGAGYLERLKELCTQYGIILIFDEVVSGFRMGLGGAQAYYGVTPDLCTFGKALAGGMPIAGFAGRQDIMNLLAGNFVSHLGTYNSNAISASAALATLAELERDDGAVFASIQKFGRRLCADFNAIFQRYNAPLCADGHGAVFSIFAAQEPPRSYRDTLSHDIELLSHIHRSLLDKGVWIFGRGNLMISSAHTEASRLLTIKLMEEVITELPITFKKVIK